MDTSRDSRNWPCGARVRIDMPATCPSRRWRRASAISLLERSRSAAGVSAMRISPRARERPQVPEVLTETTDETASGTWPSTSDSMTRVCASRISSRVPTSMSPLMRTSPSSLGGRNSVPIYGNSSRLPPNRAAAARMTGARCRSTRPSRSR